MGSNSKLDGLFLVMGLHPAASAARWASRTWRNWNETVLNGSGVLVERVHRLMGGRPRRSWTVSAIASTSTSTATATASASAKAYGSIEVGHRDHADTGHFRSSLVVRREAVILAAVAVCRAFWPGGSIGWRGPY